eukprot:scaffold688_cov365-Pinguiococcus_pyrenoidosus.AAC.4
MEKTLSDDDAQPLPVSEMLLEPSSAAFKSDAFASEASASSDDAVAVCLPILECIRCCRRGLCALPIPFQRQQRHLAENAIQNASETLPRTAREGLIPEVSQVDPRALPSSEAAASQAETRRAMQTNTGSAEAKEVPYDGSGLAAAMALSPTTPPPTEAAGEQGDIQAPHDLDAEGASDGGTFEASNSNSNSNRVAASATPSNPSYPSREGRDHPQHRGMQEEQPGQEVALAAPAPRDSHREVDILTAAAIMLIPPAPALSEEERQRPAEAFGPLRVSEMLLEASSEAFESDALESDASAPSDDAVAVWAPVFAALLPATNNQAANLAAAHDALSVSDALIEVLADMSTSVPEETGAIEV